jgi:hypothetical protein
VDVSRGRRIGRVSSEWFARPDDERYLSLSELYEAVRGRAERAQLIGSLASFSIMDLRTVRRIAWFADDVKPRQTGIKKVA